MTEKAWMFAAGAAGALLALSPAVPGAPAPDGAAIFEQRCKSCHDPAVERAPGRAELAARPRADIVASLTTGIMAPLAQGLSAEQIQSVAAYLTPGAQAGSEPPAQGRPAATSAPVDPMCEVNPPLRAGRSDWASAGFDAASTRYQPEPGLKASDLPKLKLKWAFSMSGGGQPTVIGDWLFTTNRSGKFYALNAKTGCVHWVVNDVVSRTTPVVVRASISPSGWATLVAVASRVVRAFDAQTGAALWSSAVLEDHPSSVMSGSPVVSGERIFVPISSIEEATAMRKDYVCCTFRGSVAALDLKTGKLLWKTYMITAPLQAIHREGKDLQGPAGAAVWAAPTIDEKRGLVYAVTGDSYTDVDTDGADAVVALDMKTGSVKWKNQVTVHDNFVIGCGPNAAGNCPTTVGPDYDFGASPILFTRKNGKQVLLAGQKSGLAYGFDPDSGALLWKTAVGAGSALGGVEWGIAADRDYLFVPISDILRLRANASAPASGDMPAKPGISALDPATGRIVWQTPAPVAPCHYAADKDKPSVCVRAQSAAPGAMPGIVFSGTLDGWFRAYDAKTGKIVWEYSTTAQSYGTVDGVKGQPGGGIDGMGPTIAGGMIYTMSGFNGASRVGSNGINVLLAFGLADQ
ncbi:MAG: PQQ-binding-like beta-propeller repeat protein [Steroidobacteraceae bacterium]